MGFYTICSQSLSVKSILPGYMPNRVITVFSKGAPNAINIIQRPSLGTKPRVPLCIPSYVEMKWLRAAIQSTKIMMLLIVSMGAVATRDDAVTAMFLMKSLWMAALIEMPTPLPTARAKFCLPSFFYRAWITQLTSTLV